MSNDVIEALRAWGCDIDSALERFEDDRELYRECLYIFVKDGNFEALAKALKDDNYDDAFNYAHALKGVAGNLSLGPLADSIAVVSDHLKHSEYEAAVGAYDKLVANKAKFDALLEEYK